ncbi:MAG: hypothetical protein P0S93_06450, partial [Candidatus Neptunochlamydia sp.]|nr:hypothetical protein [Candidatus Neptunochlamydia sp.]
MSGFLVFLEKECHSASACSLQKCCFLAKEFLLRTYPNTTSIVKQKLNFLYVFICYIIKVLSSKKILTHEPICMLMKTLFPKAIRF